jgi:hypothetical protein
VDNEPKDLRPEKGDGALVLITRRSIMCAAGNPAPRVLANANIQR